MSNHNQPLIYGAIGLIIGVVVTLGTSNGIMGDNKISTTKNERNSITSMNDMMATLKGKSGDEFDKAFIQEMIVHHQGAINMANLAKSSAKHDEIKKLADAIIIAQTKEISEMSGWYKGWYNSEVPTTGTDGIIMSH